MLRYDIKTGVKKIKTKTTLAISGTVLAITGLLAALVVPLAANASTVVVYNSIPSPSAGNYPSEAFEAQSASEFGGQVQMTETATNPTVTVQMSSWGCESGTWFNHDCVTTPGSTFSEPITLKVYNVGTNNTVGSPVASVTQTFQIPYRPSANPVCDDGRWSSDGTLANCFNGFATPIVFSLTGTIPQNAIIAVAYNTTHYGYSPIGESAPCFSESGGCGYDSLNVALTGPATVGSQSAPSDAYLNSSWAGAYCGVDKSTGTFRLDAGCWTGFQPNIKVEVNAANPGDQCKNNAWKTMNDGTKKFKNQGDCVSYFATNGRNAAAGTSAF